MCWDGYSGCFSLEPGIASLLLRHSGFLRVAREFGEVAVGQPRRGCGDADGGGLDEKTAAIVHTDIIIRRER